MNSFRLFNRSTHGFYNLTKKYFSVLPKCPKMELTMRTPYNTFFRDFTGFSRLYVGTIKGLMCISNRTPPVIYVLPAGEVRVMNLQKSEGSFVEANASGEFVHAGGYAIVHDNNSVDINLYECVEKEKFSYDKLDTSSTQNVESDSKYDREIQSYAHKKVLRKK